MKDFTHTHVLMFNIKSEFLLSQNVLYFKDSARTCACVHACAPTNYVDLKSILGSPRCPALKKHRQGTMSR
jgi:hypothetical protein